jgi:hypothetical protein
MRRHLCLWQVLRKTAGALSKVCTGKTPVLKVKSADAPRPELIHAHLSPFSAPLECVHPVLGNSSVAVSASS